MSVAFRRESDEEHLEPKFELPLPPGPNLVTARGLAVIAERIAALEADLASIPAAPANEVARAAALRDLRYWKARQVSAELVPPASGEKVEFGVEVTIVLRGAKKTFRLVGHDEADPADGLLSFAAPLARAMHSAEPGDVLPFGGEDDAIEIVTITVPV